MNETDETQKRLAKSRAIITTACEMLLSVSRGPGGDYGTGGGSAGGPYGGPGSGEQAGFCHADCYVLLQDATKLFCQSVSEKFGEPPERRWSPVVPELLLAHPEKCREMLALLELEEFKELSYFQFVAA
jgi:hypothetical protein